MYKVTGGDLPPSDCLSQLPGGRSAGTAYLRLASPPGKRVKSLKQWVYAVSMGNVVFVFGLPEK